MAAGDGSAVSKIVGAIERREDILDGHLGEIEIPTLIVWGRQDRVIPVRLGEGTQRDIAGSKLVLFDHCGLRRSSSAPGV